MISWATRGMAERTVSLSHSAPDRGEVPKARIRKETSVTANCSRKPAAHATSIRTLSRCFMRKTERPVSLIPTACHSWLMPSTVKA